MPSPTHPDSLHDGCGVRIRTLLINLCHYLLGLMMLVSVFTLAALITWREKCPAPIYLYPNLLWYEVSAFSGLLSTNFAPFISLCRLLALLFLCLIVLVEKGSVVYHNFFILFIYVAIYWFFVPVFMFFSPFSFFLILLRFAVSYIGTRFPGLDTNAGSTFILSIYLFSLVYFLSPFSLLCFASLSWVYLYVPLH